MFVLPGHFEYFKEDTKKLKFSNLKHSFPVSVTVTLDSERENMPQADEWITEVFE